jgi:hypothetical protein
MPWQAQNVKRNIARLGRPAFVRACGLNLKHEYKGAHWYTGVVTACEQDSYRLKSDKGLSDIAAVTKNIRVNS